MSRSAKLITSTDYAHPKRPAVLRAYNTLLDPPKLELEALLDAARRATGLEDFGDASFCVPLAVLIESIEREARLHAFGRTVIRGRLVSILENRLRAERIVRETPSIESTPIVRPIVIAGLQRTGTTLLHRLLAADPQARALRGWEALRPAPLPGEGREGRWRRRFGAKVAELGLLGIAPEFFAVHPVEAESPEEDILLLDHSFMSQSSEAIMHVPAYSAWLERNSSLGAYRYLAKLLKVLLWQHPGDFWVLKTPHHMEYLSEVLAVFPDALIVQTHRDPQATMGSFCSMVAHGRGVFSDVVEPREIGSHWLRKVRRMLDRSIAVRDGGAQASFVDISYYDLISDSMAQVRRIYAHAGRTLTPEAAAAMQHVLARDKQHRYGRHAYSARDFGLSPARIEEAFSDYRARFDIRRELTNGTPHLQSKATAFGHRTTLAATLTAFVDLWSHQPGLHPVDAGLRLDGRTALVTGANCGLGKAVATDLARRGARVLLACRSGIPDAGLEIARASGSHSVEMFSVDLANLDSVSRLADELARRNERIDFAICNAGLMPSKPGTTQQGHCVMFGVHYLANHLLLKRLLTSGVIPNDVFASNGRSGLDIPRIVFVASETHRSADALAFDRLGAPVAFGANDAILHYASSKLAMLTFASELARKLTTATGPSVAVHGLCPGPIASRIARDAPPLLEPVVQAAMRQAFQSPEKAARPVVYLATAPELAGDTGWYLHLMRRKAMSDAATDLENGRRLWEAGERMLEKWL
jgi:NAD(P)-dependent dehydrogenase (short-subunit alcohol dehydrogenase family)